MKRFKQIAALLLAAVLTLSMSLPAMAASPGNDEEYGTKDDTGTITVSGLEDDNYDAGKITVTAYPVILATYDASGNFSGYVSLYPEIFNLDEYDENTNPNGILHKVQDVDTQGDPIEDSYHYEYQLTEAQLDAIHDMIREKKGAVEVENGTVTTSNGTYTVGDTAATSVPLTQAYDQQGNKIGNTVTGTVAVGAYLIDIQGADAVEYNVAVASVYYGVNSESSSNTVVDPGEVNMVGDDNVWVKAETPTDDKKIVGVNGTSPYDKADGENGGGGGDYGVTANIGDVIDYEVTVTTIPHYGGDYPTFEVVDHLSEGLEYLVTQDESGNVTGSLHVYVRIPSYDDRTQTTTYTWKELDQYDEDTGDGYYTLDVSDDGHTITVNFVIETKDDEGNTIYTYTLNEYEGYNLAIDYQATLTDEAALNDLDNPNQVDLIYTTDSTINAEDEYGPYDPENPNPNDPRTHERHRTHTYTFDIDGTLLPDENDDDGLESGPGSTGKGSLTWDIVTKTGADTTTIYVDANGNEITQEQYDELDDSDKDGWEVSTSTPTVSLPLDGAQFTIYDADFYDDQTNADKHIYENDAMNNSDADYWENPVTSDADGKLTIVGLAAGTYYMKETNAPSGYTLNTTLYQIVIEANLDESTGLLQSWTVTINAQDSNGNFQKVGSSSFTVSQTIDYTDSKNTSGNNQADTSNVTENTDGSVTIPVTLEDGSSTDVTMSKTSEVTYGDDTYTTYEGTYTDGKENADGTYTVNEYSFTAVKHTDENGNESWTVTGNLTTATSDTSSDAKIANTQIIELPSTGGMGTILFTVIGCLIMILAASAYIFNRRRNRVAQ